MVTNEKPIDEIKSIEELTAHKAGPSSDAPNSPLFMIREKELEISGRVLASKKKAEQIVADARRKATETLATAEADGEAAAREVERKMIADAENEAAKILANVDNEVAEVRAQAEARRAHAAEVVTEAVKRV